MTDQVKSLGVKNIGVDKLHPHPDNPNRGDVEAITESLNEFGQYRAIVALADGTIIAGHHVWQAAKGRGDATVRVDVIDTDPDTARRILLADNRIAELGPGIDPERLLAVLETGIDLSGTGYDADYLDQLQAAVSTPETDEHDDHGAEDSDGERPEAGDLLAIMDVTIKDPEVLPELGTRWTVGHHTLVVAKLLDQHHLWRADLADGVLFCPYPEPYLTLTTRARETPMLLVQPNRLLAGHLLDRHRAAFPDEQVAQQ